MLVESAYEQLVAEGYLEASSRRGYFVAGLDGILPPVAPERRAEQEMFPGRRDGEAPDLQEKKWRVDFSPRGIDLDSFPFSTWRRISRAVLKEEDTEMFLKGSPQGDLLLREAIRDYLHAARGVNCTAEQIIIGAGNEYLLILLSQLLGRETGIAMEDPGRPGSPWRIPPISRHTVFLGEWAIRFFLWEWMTAASGYRSWSGFLHPQPM